MAAWPRGADRLLFLGLVAVHLAPLFLFSHLPTRDGPVHVEGALLLLRYAGRSGSLFRGWFVFEPPIANWLDHLLLAGLSLAMPGETAEKIVVALFVVGLPVAARRALEAVRPGAGFLAVLVFPFIYSWPLHMGFYNFCLSLPLFFATVASWLRHRGALSGSALGRLTGWVILMYFAHPVSMVCAAVLLLVMPVWSAGRDALVATRERRPVGPVLREGLVVVRQTVLAFLPAVALFLVYAHDQRSPPYERLAPARLLRDLARLDVLVTFQAAEVAPAIALALALAVLAIRALWARRGGRVAAADGFLVGAGAFTAIYLAAPIAAAGGHYLTPRLMVYPVLSLLLWCGSVAWSRTIRIAVAVAGAAISLWLWALHFQSYGAANEALDEYLSAAPWIERGSTVLPLHFAGRDDGLQGLDEFPRVDVLAHAGAYVAASRWAADLAFYEGTKRGQFPMQYRPRLDPYHEMGDNPESVPPCVDLPAYERQTGRTIDYVLTWKEQKRQHRRGCAEATLAQIDARYDLVYASRPRGLLRVFRRRELIP